MILSNAASNTEQMEPVVLPSEEAALFADFLNGDDTAAIRIFRMYHSRLYIYCSKILNNARQAEDVTSEIWERVIRLRVNPPEVLNPTGFLFRIARNFCINAIKQRRHTVSLDSISEAAHPSGSIPGTSDIEELVLSSLEGLRFTDRDILVLHVYCGYQLEEIAGMMDISPGAIWTRASRARAQLRKIIMNLVSKDSNSTTHEQRRNNPVSKEDMR